MRNTYRMTVLAALIAFACGASAADVRLPLLPPAIGDQVPTSLVASKASPATELSREAIQVSWALQPNAELDAAPVPFVRDSREYWTQVSAEQLKAGVNLRTTTTGAVIRLSPLGGDAKRELDPAFLEVRSAGKVLAGEQAMANLADSAALARAGTAFPEGTVAFKLRDAAGSGNVELVAAKARGDYLLHVFEPNSRHVLNLTTNRDTVLHGAELEVMARFDAPTGSLDVVGGALTAPDGHTVDLKFARASASTFIAKVRHDALSGAGSGLWEVHAFASAHDGQVEILRDAKTAFASIVPSARLNGAVTLPEQRGLSLDLRVGVEVSAASRYQVSGVLYGRDAEGVARPVAVAQSAVWLEAGQRNIDLTFDQASMANAAITAPYEVRDLRLVDQAEMQTLERRERGFQIAQ